MSDQEGILPVDVDPFGIKNINTKKRNSQPNLFGASDNQSDKENKKQTRPKSLPLPNNRRSTSEKELLTPNHKSSEELNEEAPPLTQKENSLISSQTSNHQILREIMTKSGNVFNSNNESDEKKETTPSKSQRRRQSKKQNNGLKNAYENFLKQFGLEDEPQSLKSAEASSDTISNLDTDDTENGSAIKCLPTPPPSNEEAVSLISNSSSPASTEKKNDKVNETIAGADTNSTKRELKIDNERSETELQDVPPPLLRYESDDDIASNNKRLPGYISGNDDFNAKVFEMNAKTFKTEIKARPSTQRRYSVGSADTSEIPEINNATLRKNAAELKERLEQLAAKEKKIESKAPNSQSKVLPGDHPLSKSTGEGDQNSRETKHETKLVQPETKGHTLYQTAVTNLQKQITDGRTVVADFFQKQKELRREEEQDDKWSFLRHSVWDDVLKRNATKTVTPEDVIWQAKQDPNDDGERHKGNRTSRTLSKKLDIQVNTTANMNKQRLTNISNEQEKWIVALENVELEKGIINGVIDKDTKSWNGIAKKDLRLIDIIKHKRKHPVNASDTTENNVLTIDVTKSAQDIYVAQATFSKEELLICRTMLLLDIENSLEKDIAAKHTEMRATDESNRCGMKSGFVRNTKGKGLTGIMEYSQWNSGWGTALLGIFAYNGNRANKAVMEIAKSKNIPEQDFNPRQGSRTAKQNTALLVQETIIKMKP